MESAAPPPGPPPVSRTDTLGAAGTPDPDSHHGLPATEPGASRSSGELAALGDRFPAADGALALAAFGVLFTHVGLLSGFNFANPGIGAYLARAEVGVSIFFVLSGFLLCRPFAVRRFAGHPPGETGKYARRRLLRILPAYWVALTIVAFVLHAPPFVEPSFYLFLPMWAWLLARRKRLPERQRKVEVGSAWLRHRRLELPRAWSGTRLTLMCWGAAVVLFWAMATQMGFPLSLDFSPQRAFAQRVIYSVIGLLIVAPIVLGRQDRGLALKVLANPVAVWLGLVSYGVYIWHKAFQYKYLEWTGQDDLNASFTGMLVATVALSLVAAAGSWYLIERPLMRRRDRRPTARRVPAEVR